MKQKTLSCPPRTAVAYARYSSAGQRDVSIDQQLKDIRAYAEREGYKIVREYADHARSGFKDISARVEFNTMIADAVSGSFDTVLCWKVDRFGRNRKDSAVYKDKLSALGVSVVYVMEPIPEGAAGVLTEGMLEAIAEWYSRNLSENVTRGMMDNALKCLYNGTKVLGYDRGPDNHYAINEDEASTVRLIFSRYLKGYSAAMIAKELNASGLRSSRGRLFREETVLRVIRNERYCGTYFWGDVRIPGGMPAIVSMSDFEEAQRMREKTQRHIENHPADFLLTGKLFCGHCGKAMIGDSGTSHTGTTHYYYSCQSHKSKSGCPKKSIRKDALEDQVISFIMNTCLSSPEIERIADAVMEEMDKRRAKSPLAAMKQEHAEVKKKLLNINNAIANGIYGPSTVDMLHELEENEKDLRENIGLLEYTEAQFLDRDRVLFFLHRFAKMNPKDPDDRRKLIQYFINAIYVYDDHLKIVINASESNTTVPLEDLPDIPIGSDTITSGVLRAAQPNHAAVIYCVAL